MACDQRKESSFLETEDSGKAVRCLGMYRGGMVSEGKGTEWEGEGDDHADAWLGCKER